jgi:putative tryptophan/tyrosine transport system substrate-binding protein
VSVRLFPTVLFFFGVVFASYAAEPPSRVFHIGIVSATPRSQSEHVAFEDRLRELGYVEGRNLTIDFRQDDNVNRLVVEVGDLVRGAVDVLVIGGQDAVLKAAIKATAANSTPVVFRAVDSDPLAKGYIRSLARPGGNLTGMLFSNLEMIAKGLDLLTQAVPHIARIILLRSARASGRLRHGQPQTWGFRSKRSNCTTLPMTTSVPWRGPTVRAAMFSR